MALRNIDIDSAIRACVCGDSEQMGALLEVANAKIKALKLKADSGLAVAKAPKHSGRKNPLSGQLKGSGDLNLRGLIDFVESIDALPTLAEGVEADAVFQQQLAEMQTAHDLLLKLQATLQFHTK